MERPIPPDKRPRVAQKADLAAGDPTSQAGYNPRPFGMTRAHKIDEPEDDPQPESSEASETPGSAQVELPFSQRTFGGAFVWARAAGFTCTVLRIMERENVVISTRNRRDMIVMLTGGRAVLEVKDGNDVDRVELMPASPVPIEPDKAYRLLALTEVELFTVYTPLPD